MKLHEYNKDGQEKGKNIIQETVLELEARKKVAVHLKRKGLQPTLLTSLFFLDCKKKMAPSPG